MKKVLIISLTLLVLASAGVASPLSCAGGVHLDQFIANYSGISNACLIGDKLFYDFGFSSSGPTATAAGTAVLLDPGDGVTDPGIIFSNGGFLAFSGQTLDVTITYSIATNGGSAVMSGYGLTLAGSDTPAGLGTGSVTETFSNSPAGTPLVTTIGVNGTAGVDFLPWVSGTTVTTQIHLQSQGTDLVSISAVQEHFSETVPEPYESVLIGSGLLFFGLCRKRKAIKR
jgi:hypothetical protein